MGWTKEQEDVIRLRKRNLLVSAAAGSGKTAVLVERIVSLITDPLNPVDIDRLLVVTFTRAAAGEMRERIRNRLREMAAEKPEDQNLLRQSVLVHHAQITTIDSFCFYLVKNHFGKIGLEPGFRVADQGELDLLAQDTMEQLFEQEYEAGSKAFLTLVDAYSSRRSDAPVREMVSRLHRESESAPWPDKWVEKIQKEQEALISDPAGQSRRLFERIVGQTRVALKDARSRLLELAEEAKEPGAPAAYPAFFQTEASMFDDWEQLDSYEACRKFMTSLKFARMPQVRKGSADDRIKTNLSDARKAIKEGLEKRTKTCFSLQEEDLAADCARSAPMLGELCRLTLAYDGLFAARKAKKHIVSFSDIAHGALRILVDPETGAATETAEELSASFDQIMIDEYQDSNAVQEAILTAIARKEPGEENLFMVGDVKQSIYRFRQARPDLFMKKYAAYEKPENYQPGMPGCRIELDRNFRSRKEVLSFCNDLFFKLMASDLGGVQYNDEAALYPGAEGYEASDQMEPELLLMERKDGDGEKMDAVALEAALMANRIRQMVSSGFRVFDKETKTTRPCCYRDMVILLRGAKSAGQDYVNVLESYGIPAHVESTKGYFSALEVETVLNYLRIIDNPWQDIPLTAVLLSPLCGLTDEELAELRTADRKMPFSRLVMDRVRGLVREADKAAAADACKADEKNTACAGEVSLSPLDEKLLDFGRQLEEFRHLSMRTPIHELLRIIYERTGYVRYAAALPDGKRRSENLLMLADKAIAFEKTSYKGLFSFIRYIEKLKTYEIDFGEAGNGKEAGNVVRVMTIHKSKGLEFPIVFLGALQKKFNTRDSDERLVVQADLGAALMPILGKPRVRYKSLPKAMLSEQIEEENLGEELRVLYVALTRAREKLILTAVVDDHAKTMDRMRGNVLCGPLSYSIRRDASSYLDWILPAMLSYEERRKQIIYMTPEDLIFDQVVDQADRAGERCKRQQAIESADPALVESIRREMAWTYPYARDGSRKAKYSVSEIKKAKLETLASRDEETGGDLEAFRADLGKGAGPEADGRSEKKEREKGPNRGALRGTAMHRFMECVDFKSFSSPEKSREFVREQRKQMLASGRLPAEEDALIDEKALSAFFGTGPALEMAEADRRGFLERERQFMMEHDGVLVQGVIDVFWQRPDGSFALLDYKTDRVTSAAILPERYAIQLDLYAEALQKVFGCEHPIAVDKYIYSFALGTTCSI